MLIYLQAVIKNLLSIFCRCPSKVKLSIYILQNTSSSPTHSSKNKRSLAGKLPLFSILHIFCFVCFQGQNLRFAPFYLSSLVINSYFLNSNFPLLAPKNLLFNDYFALSGHEFHGSKRFCLYNCRGNFCFLPCIQQHFALRLAPKCLAFSGISHCVQHQNALRLAPKCTAFSTKTHCVQRHIALYLAANSPKPSANCGFMQCVFILPTFTCYPFFHLNKPS